MLDVVSNGLFSSSHYMDDGSWNWGTIQWKWAYDTQMTWILALCILLMYQGRVIFIVNCIDGQIEFMWSSNFWTSSWWGQKMNVSSTYLSHINGFHDIDPNAISSKYSMYMLPYTGDNAEPIASPSSCLYISDPILK